MDFVLPSQAGEDIFFLNCVQLFNPTIVVLRVFANYRTKPRGCCGFFFSDRQEPVFFLDTPGAGFSASRAERVFSKSRAGARFDPSGAAFCPLSPP